MGILKGIGIGIAILVVAVLILGTVGSIMNVEEKQELSELSDLQLRNMAVNWNYESLLRNIDDYNRNIIRFVGKVTVPSEDGVVGIDVGNSNVLRHADYDLIFVEYDKKRFLINDEVEGYGIVDGYRNMVLTAFGGSEFEESVPNLEAIKVICTSC